jgi:rod shape-determining protein MreD
MRDFLRGVLEALATALGAFVLYSLAGRAGASAVLVFNAFSLAVILFAMEKGEVFGGILGTACGLLQDSFTFGVFGVAGFSKTLLGIVAGYASRKLHVRPPLRSFVFIFACAAGELAVWAFLYTLVFSRGLAAAGPVLLFQPVTTAALGGLVLALVRRLKARKA